MSDSSYPEPPPHGTVHRNRATDTPSEAPARSSTTASFGEAAGDQRRAAAAKTAAEIRAKDPLIVRWSRRNWTWMNNNKGKSAIGVVGFIFANFAYDRYYLWNNTTPSPYADHDLLYRMEDDATMTYVDYSKRWLSQYFESWFPQARRWRFAKSRDEVDLDAEYAAATTVTPEEQRRPRMFVTAGQAEAREGYWRVRINERNWSLLSRDMQRQQDEYDYRRERSRDNDFDRHASGVGSKS